MRLFCTATVALIISATMSPVTVAAAEKLAGRYITFKKVYDGWWDAVCDTAPDGTDPRCYVQYVDPYSPSPKFRAAMVDFIYRRIDSGKSEPVITFDVEPDLSFAKHVRMTIIGPAGKREAMPVVQCPTSKCVYSGAAASAILASWSTGQALELAIDEHDGKQIIRQWPLGNVGEMVRLIAKQRRERQLP